MAPSRSVSVEQQLFVRATARKVFDAISTPRGLCSWMVARADLPLRTGAGYELEFEGGWKHRGTVQRLRTGRSISLAWAWEGVPLKGTMLTLSVTPKKGGASFRLTHTGFPREPRWTDLYGISERYWMYYAMNLKSVLETGRDLRSPKDG